MRVIESADWSSLENSNVGAKKTPRLSENRLGVRFSVIGSDLFAVSDKGFILFIPKAFVKF